MPGPIYPLDSIYTGHHPTPPYVADPQANSYSTVHGGGPRIRSRPSSRDGTASAGEGAVHRQSGTDEHESPAGSDNNKRNWVNGLWQRQPQPVKRALVVLGPFVVAGTIAVSIAVGGPKSQGISEPHTESGMRRRYR